jgi:ABC-2 type transport system ATP-binding protein
MSEAAIRVEGLGKRYGTSVAVDSLGFTVASGACFGLLGPNGAGKSTTIQMLTTLLPPSAGRAWIVGHEITAAPVAVRAAIGLVFQDTALDRTLSADENLRFAGALHGLPAALIRERSDELLALFELREKRAMPVARLSGGQRRALDIARGVLHRPRVLFLDEPTTGLDLVNRRAVWRFLDRLRAQDGTTLVLTTHLLEEAAGCDQVLFLKGGAAIAHDAPAQLIARLGAFVLDVEDGEVPAPEFSGLGASIRAGTSRTFRIADPGFTLARLDPQQVARARSVRLRRPDLNDVYLWLTTTPEAP